MLGIFHHTKTKNSQEKRAESVYQIELNTNDPMSSDTFFYIPWNKCMYVIMRVTDQPK